LTSTCDANRLTQVSVSGWRTGAVASMKD